jgi:hypothetical protein
MAFENFWKRDRERYGGDRNPERQWRSSGNEWRESGRGSWRPESSEYTRRAGGGENRDFGRQSGGQEAEYYGGREQGYGGGYGQSYEGEREYGGQGYRSDYAGGRSRDEDRNYGRDFESRSYTSGSYGREFTDPSFGGSYGGAQGRDWQQRRGSYGYGGQSGYGAMGGAETGSSAYRAAEFRGKGPRGYRRSDDRIREDVCDLLTEDPILDASNLEVTAKDGEVTLSGSVNSREDKRRAEDLVESISGVKDVHNTLRVVAEQRSAEGAAGAVQRH